MYSDSLLEWAEKKIIRTEKKIRNFERELLYHKTVYHSELTKTPKEKRPSKVYQLDFFAG